MRLELPAWSGVVEGPKWGVTLASGQQARRCTGFTGLTALGVPPLPLLARAKKEGTGRFPVGGSKVFTPPTRQPIRLTPGG